MRFRTEYHPERSHLTLSPEKTAVLIGSCFSQNISSKMKECCWDSVLPGGTLYNPLSIGEVLYMFLDEETGLNKFEENLFLSDGIWHNRMFDSSLSSRNREDCLQEFRHRSRLFNEAIRQGESLIVTFGTSICYFLKESGKPAGNCHKQPSKEFSRRRLTIEEIVGYWQTLLTHFRKQLPGLKVIFTVSPVRHLKDGFVGNSRSKAVLQLAVEEICSSDPLCDYFPAYEILNDDLRDYRFYASDLLHPSDEGIGYIWEIFQFTYLDDTGLKIIEAGEKRFRRENHRRKTGALGKPLSAI